MVQSCFLIVKSNMFTVLPLGSTNGLAGPAATIPINQTIREKSVTEESKGYRQKDFYE